MPSKSETPTLKPMTPNRTFYFATLPCEKKVAELRNKVVDAMAREDVEAMIKLYYKNRAGMKNAAETVHDFGIILAILNGGFPTFFQPDAKHNAVSTAMLVGLVSFSAFAFAHLLPNMRNMLSYRETLEGCKDWLAHRLDKRSMKALNSPAYTPQLFQNNSVNKVLNDNTRNTCIKRSNMTQ